MTIFASDGTVIDRDALRSVGFGVRRQPAVRVDRAADTKTVEVINETTGGTAGWHTHKADGRIAAVATPDVVSGRGVWMAFPTSAVQRKFIRTPWRTPQRST